MDEKTKDELLDAIVRKGTKERMQAQKESAAQNREIQHMTSDIRSWASDIRDIEDVAGAILDNMKGYGLLRKFELFPDDEMGKFGFHVTEPNVGDIRVKVCMRGTGDTVHDYIIVNDEGKLESVNPNHKVPASCLKAFHENFKSFRAEFMKWVREITK